MDCRKGGIKDAENGFIKVDVRVVDDSLEGRDEGKN